jgi:hypothetical protein
MGTVICPQLAAAEVAGECVAIQAQYIFDSFGKFPATVPSLMILN